MRLSLLRRVDKTVESYLESPIGSHFLTEKFLDGISTQRENILKRQSRTIATLVGLTTFLAFFDSIHGSINVQGVEIEIFKSADAAISVLVSVALISSVLATLDQLTLDRIIAAIGRHSGVYSFNIFLSDRFSGNLWVEAITPKNLGEESGLGQNFTFALIAIIAVLIYLILISYPLSVCIVNFISIMNDSNSSLMEIIMAVTSILLCSYAVILLATFVIPFEFKPAKFHEGTGMPTKEFIEMLEKEAAEAANQRDGAN